MRISAFLHLRGFVPRLCRRTCPAPSSGPIPSRCGKGSRRRWRWEYLCEAALTRSLADETGAVLKTGRQVWTYAGYSDCDYHSTRPAWLAAEGVRLSRERFALP